MNGLTTPKLSYSFRIFHVLTEDTNHSRQTQEILQKECNTEHADSIHMEPKLYGNFPQFLFHCKVLLLDAAQGSSELTHANVHALQCSTLNCVKEQANGKNLHRVQW